MVSSGQCRSNPRANRFFPASDGRLHRIIVAIGTKTATPTRLQTRRALQIGNAGGTKSNAWAQELAMTYCFVGSTACKSSERSRGIPDLKSQIHNPHSPSRPWNFSP
jgi:hypothetical protein